MEGMYRKFKRHFRAGLNAGEQSRLACGACTLCTRDGYCRCTARHIVLATGCEQGVPLCLPFCLPSPQPYFLEWCTHVQYIQ
jgi:hypothetical protein